MEKLDQGRLYPNLEVPGLTCSGPPAWEASTLEKSHPDSLLIAIRNIYTYEPATGPCLGLDIFISNIHSEHLFINFLFTVLRLNG
jgi:hypothetical protein